MKISLWKLKNGTALVELRWRCKISLALLITASSVVLCCTFSDHYSLREVDQLLHPKLQNSPATWFALISGLTIDNKPVILVNDISPGINYTALTINSGGEVKKKGLIAIYTYSISVNCGQHFSALTLSILQPCPYIPQRDCSKFELSNSKQAFHVEH